MCGSTMNGQSNTPSSTVISPPEVDSSNAKHKQSIPTYLNVEF